MVGVLTVLVVAFFGRVIDYEFTLDSHYFMTQDARVTGFEVGELLTTDWWNAKARDSHDLESNGGLYRPISLLWMATFRSLSSAEALAKKRAPALNAANIVLHLVGVLLRFVLLLWILDGVRHAARWACVGAAILAIHPIASEAVCTQVGCAEGLSVVFASASLLALLRALDGGGRWNYGLHGLFLMLALLSKESAVALPFAAGLLAFLVRGRAIVPSLLATLPGFLVVGVWVGLRAAIIGSVADVDDEVLALFPTGARIATALAVIGAYDLPALVFPASLHPNPTLMEIPPASGSGDPRTIVGLITVAGMLAGVLLAWRRAPRVAFGLAFLGGMLVPVSNLLVMIGALAATRFLYLPLTGLAIAVAAGAARLHENRRLRPAASVLAGWFVVVPAFLHDAGAWSDQVTLFESAAEAYPHAPQAWYQLGVEYQSAGRMADARRAFEAAAATPLPEIPGTVGWVFEDALELRFRTVMNRGGLALENLGSFMRRGDRGGYERALKDADDWFRKAAEIAGRGRDMRAAGAPIKTDWTPLQTDALMQRATVRLQRLGVLGADQRTGAIAGVRRIAREIELLEPQGLKAPLLRFNADQAEGKVSRSQADAILGGLYRRALGSSVGEARPVVQAYVDHLNRQSRRDEAARALLDARARGVVTPAAGPTCEAALAAIESRNASTRALGRSVLEDLLDDSAHQIPAALRGKARSALGRRP